MIQSDVAESRVDIDSHRLLVLKAAHMMDTRGNKVPLSIYPFIYLSMHQSIHPSIIETIQYDNRHGSGRERTRPISMHADNVINRPAARIL